MKKKELRPVYAHLEELVGKGLLDDGKRLRLQKAFKAVNHGIVTRNYNKAEKAINQFCKELLRE
jgi:hypothetical protein